MENTANDFAEESYIIEDRYKEQDSSANESLAHSEDEDYIQLNDSDVESYVLQNNNDDSTVIYAAVSDDQIQTVIPVSVVIPHQSDLNTPYNQLDYYLDEENWGVNNYLFEGVSFEIDLSNHEVLMQLPDNFSLGDGSSNAYMFSEILTAMFVPHNIEKVVFDEPIELGSFGNISELPLSRQDNEIYKIFQADENYRKFLVPIKGYENISIEEAFEEMKNGQDHFNIFPTIPEDLQLSLTASNQELIINFNNEQVFEDEQIATIMIEAILMTAKSYGYELVRFTNVSSDRIGPYQLSEAIHVPKAVNPIYQ